MKKSTIYRTIGKKDKAGVKKFLFQTTYYDKKEESTGSGTIEGKEVFVKSRRVKKDNLVKDIEQIYDKTGNLISVIETGEKFDEKGNLINRTYIENGNLIEDVFYLYEDGKRKFEFQKDAEGNGYSTEIKYNREGRESELIFRTNDEITTRVEYTYENDHKEISRTFDSENNLLSKSITFYDSESNPIYQINYDKKDNITSSALNVFARDKLLESALFDKNQIIEKRTSYSYYTETGLLKQQKDEYFSDGELIKKEVYDWEYEVRDE